MVTKSSGFSLIELLVVVAVVGILAAIGTLSYQGYIAGTKKKSTENMMQQMSLAQTEIYSDSGMYFTQEENCTPGEEFTRNLSEVFFDSENAIDQKNGWLMCITPTGDSGYTIRASDCVGCDDEEKITLTSNGIWGETY